MMSDLRILVVDDSPTMRRIIVGQLKQAGYHDVGEAEDGLHALEELEDGDYNFILTDWNMPRMDGLAFIKELRSREAYKTIPLMVVTTRNAQADVITAVKEGANNFVVKPFGSKTLSQKIDQVLGAMKGKVAA